MRSLNVSRPVAQWRDPRHRCGLSGEVAAARFLESQGYLILAHRYRLGHHDIDLVARRGRLVAFVEVKARRSTAFGTPTESIGWRKRRDIRRVALVWVDRHGHPDDDYRFDVVGVTYSGAGFPRIEHLQGAFRDVEK